MFVVCSYVVEQGLKGSGVKEMRTVRSSRFSFSFYGGGNREEANRTIVQLDFAPYLFI